MRAAALALVTISLGSAARAACPPGLHGVTTAELFLGRDTGAAPMVGDADWRAFLDQEVTPRFPGGLSAWDIQGQWRAPDGARVREPSKALLLVLAGTRDEPGKLAAVIFAYKARFHQRSVLLIERRACAAF